MMKETLIAAGIGEKLQYLVRAYNDNTIRFVLLYPAAVEVERMARAALALTMSVDVLHASFDAGKGGARWLVHDRITPADCFACVQADDVLPVALARAAQPIDPAGQVQLHCTLVQGAEASAVVLRISHLCVDGSDGKYLLYKLAEAYARPDALHVKNGDRSVMQIYEGLSRANMRSLMCSPLGGVKTAFPYDNDEPGTPCLTVHAIPSEIMEQARRRARALGATTNDLLLAACYHALARTPGMESGAPMSVMGMMDLRKHCPGGDSAGLSNLVGSLYTALPQGVGDSFGETLQQVAAQTRALKEDPMAGLKGMPLLHGAVKSLPMGFLQRVVNRVYGSFSVGLTNLGMMDLARLRLDGLAPAGGYFGGPLKKKRAMQVSAAGFGNGCSLCVAGEYTPADGKKLHALLCSMEEELLLFAEKP